MSATEKIEAERIEAVRLALLWRRTPGGSLGPDLGACATTFFEYLRGEAVRARILEMMIPLRQHNESPEALVERARLVECWTSEVKLPRPRTEPAPVPVRRRRKTAPTR